MIAVEFFLLGRFGFAEEEKIINLKEHKGCLIMGLVRGLCYLGRIFDVDGR